MEAVRILQVTKSGLAAAGMRKMIGDMAQLSGKEPAIVDIAHGVEEAQEAMEKGSYDIVLIDFHLPDVSGLKAFELLKTKEHTTKFILVGDHCRIEILRKCISAGIDGYLDWNADTPEVQTAFEQVLEGKPYFRPEDLLKLYASECDESNNKLISEQEMYLIELLSREKSRNEIAKLMKLSTRTVAEIKKGLREKLGLKSDIGLVLFAVRNGLV